MLLPAVPLTHLAKADLNLKIRIWKGDYIGKARFRLMKFAEVPNQEGSIRLYLILESEERLAGEGVRYLHLDEVLLLSKTKRTGLVGRGHNGEVRMRDILYDRVEAVAVFPQQAELVSQVGLPEDGGEVPQESSPRCNKLETDRAEGVFGVVVGRVGQWREIVLEDGGHFMGVDLA